MVQAPRWSITGEYFEKDYPSPFMLLTYAVRPEMRDRINVMVKKREAFRPFAPAVSLEQVHHWFEVEPMTALPYMIMTVPVREHCRQALPAVTSSERVYSP